MTDRAKVHTPLAPEDQQLLDEYLATLQLQPHNTRRLFAIGFLGLPGSGKSTLADLLGERLRLPVNRSDQIRRYLNSKGFPGSNPKPASMAMMAEGRTLFYYRNNTSVVIDANFTEYATVSRSNATTYGATLLLLRLLCPDKVALERLERRTQSATTRDSTATADDYFRIKNNVARFPVINDPYAEIDTTAPIAPQIETLLKQMAKDGFIELSRNSPADREPEYR